MSPEEPAEAVQACGQEARSVQIPDQSSQGETPEEAPRHLRFQQMYPSMINSGHFLKGIRL